MDASRGAVYVLDTSVLVEGRLTEEARAGRLTASELIVPEVVLAELEAQAERSQQTGDAGLAELKALQTLAGEGAFVLRFAGGRPPGAAADARLDAERHAAVRRIAEEEGATVVTSNAVHALACEARGLAVWSFAAGGSHDVETLRLWRFFDETTMSVHLRAGTRPRAKKGTPGAMEIVRLGEEALTDRDLDLIAREIVEMAEGHPDGFIGLDMGGATVVQLANLRIAIARPPFADATEITAARPVAATTLDDYERAEIVRERLRNKDRGVLVAGAPGAGKSTFVQAIAEHLEASGWIIKTMEKPRDLVVSGEISQYTALGGDMASTADFLLLVRPDYTIYDEMRRTSDFAVFADMRLAGVGLIGVVHATRGIDALQRLVGRVELGMIPQMVDTVVFIDAGDVREIFEVEATVKMPSGLGDEGLARPVIEVREVPSKRLVYEMYTFGDQVVVMPIDETTRSGKAMWRLAARALEDEIGKLIRGRVAVEVESDTRAILYVDDDRIAAVVGRGGSNVRELEEMFGVRFDVRSLDERPPARGRDFDDAVIEHGAGWQPGGSGAGGRGRGKSPKRHGPAPRRR